MTIPAAPMSFNQPGMPAAPTSSSQAPTLVGPSNFSQTGIPGLNGGYAYEPGSQMTMFMDDLNNKVSAGTNGVLDWAKGLQAQQKAGISQQPAQMPQAPTLGGGDAGNPLAQILQMLEMLLADSPASKETQNEEQSAEGKPSSASSGDTTNPLALISQMLTTLKTKMSQ